MRWVGLRNRVKRAWELGIQSYPPGQVPARSIDALLTIESEDNKIRHEEFETERAEAELARRKQ